MATFEKVYRGEKDVFWICFIKPWLVAVCSDWSPGRRERQEGRAWSVVAVFEITISKFEVRALVNRIALNIRGLNSS